VQKKDFEEFDLIIALDQNNYETLIVVGMQTEYCIAATVKVAFEYGYDVVIPEKTHTTYDNGNIKAEDLYHHYQYHIFDKRYASVKSMTDTIDMIKSGGQE